MVNDIRFVDVQKQWVIKLNARVNGDEAPRYPCVTAGTKCPEDCQLDEGAYNHPIIIISKSKENEPEYFYFVQVMFTSLLTKVSTDHSDVLVLTWSDRSHPLY